MMTLSGFVLDGMTRGIGWRFLSMGRRIERLATMCGAIGVAIDEGRDHGLDWLLDLADSSVTYRSRYLAAPEWLPVLDMVVRDEANPRSLAFQVKGLGDYIAKIEAIHGRFASETLAPAQAALRGLKRDRSRSRERAAGAHHRPVAAGRLRRLGRHLDEVLLARRAAQRALAGRMRREAMTGSRYTRRSRDALRLPRAGGAVVAARPPDAARAALAAVVSHELRIEPATDERRDERDAFGNGVTHFAVHGPHPLLRVRMLAEVEVDERPTPVRASGRPGKRCATRCATTRRRTTWCRHA